MSRKTIDMTWLRDQYLLPPEGRGRSTADIGREIHLTKERIQQLVREGGFKQDTRRRIQYFRAQQKSRKLECPNVSLLRSMYLMPPDGEGRSHEEIARMFNVSRPTVEHWIRENDLRQQFSERHSLRMSDSGNPAYRGGNSQGYVSRRLAKRKPKRCDWCGTQNKVQIHHINHDRLDNRDDNLMWLCYHCNVLEAHLWHLQQDGCATIIEDVYEGCKRITILFANKEQ